MSRKKDQNPLFSGESAFDEEAPISENPVATLDIESMKQVNKREPEQYSLYSKTKKAHFNLDKLHPEVRKKYEDENRFVKGRFLNHECPNGNAEFHAGPYDEIQTHVMQDGATYIVKKYVADYINNNCRITKYSDSPVEIAPGQRKYVPMLSGGTQRFNFIVESFVE